MKWISWIFAPLKWFIEAIAKQFADHAIERIEQPKTIEDVGTPKSIKRGVDADIERKLRERQR